MITRTCPGCGVTFDVPEPPARGSTRVWCGEACKRQTLRHRRTRELVDILTVPPGGSPELRIAAALELLADDMARAVAWEAVRVERITGANKASRARKARKSRAKGVGKV